MTIQASSMTNGTLQATALTGSSVPVSIGDMPIVERLPLFLDRPRHRKRNVWLIVISVLLSLALLAVLLLHAAIAWVLVRPVIAPPTSNPLTEIGLPYKDVTIPSLNGKSQINGWLIPAASDRAVIFSHGYGANREEEWVPMYALADLMHSQGYQVLMFDYGYVPEGGRLMSGGVQEAQELLGAVKYMREQPGIRSVFVWGFSMGAGTALQAALLSPDIDGMVLDSTFVLNEETLYSNVRDAIHLPKYPSIPIIRMMSTLINGVNLKQVPSEQVMTTAYPMPIFFVHGDRDKLAPYRMIEQIAARQVNPLSKLWLLPKGEHELLYRAEPDAYAQQATAFFERVDRDAVALGR